MNIHVQVSIFTLFSFFCSTFSSSPCPSISAIRPCFCSRLDGEQTTVICPGLKSSAELQRATAAMKSMIIDNLMLLSNFVERNDYLDVAENEIEPIRNTTNDTFLPSKWLSSVRVKRIEIHDTYMADCFLCNNALSGQSDFLTSLATPHCGLEGHLCSPCNTKIKHVNVKELGVTPKLKIVDLSYNSIRFISGYAFPSQLTQLSEIDLSNNEVSTIYENAFANLPSLTKLNLSHNKLTTLSRKMFWKSNDTLKYLDFSWNSIQSIPTNIFENLQALLEVKLSYNLLEVILSDTFTKLPVLLEKFDVNGNFIICNCSMSGVSKLSRSTKLLGKCITPIEGEFQDIKAAISSLKCRP